MNHKIFRNINDNISFSLFQYLIGFMAFLFPKFGDNVRKIYLQLHVFFGIVILVMSVAAAMTGLTEKMLL